MARNSKIRLVSRDNIFVDETPAEIEAIARLPHSKYGLNLTESNASGSNMNPIWISLKHIVYIVEN